MSISNSAHRFFRVLALGMSACAVAEPERGLPILHYTGSSTVANFLRDAEPEYGRVRFALDTEPESAGGEEALLEGRCDLAGIAGIPTRETLAHGVEATLLGRDAIAVLVHPDNPLEGLSREDLRRIFTGEVTHWTELGGADLRIVPLIVGPASATHNVFRSAVLGEDDYAGCETVRPDAAIIDRVRADPAAIGTLSLSFLPASLPVRWVAVDGERPLPTNARYAITRPLYLLSWPGRGRVADFVAWSRSPQGQTVLLRRFAQAPGVAGPR